MDKTVKLPAWAKFMLAMIDIDGIQAGSAYIKQVEQELAKGKVKFYSTPHIDRLGRLIMSQVFTCSDSFELAMSMGMWEIRSNPYNTNRELATDKPAGEIAWKFKMPAWRQPNIDTVIWIEGNAPSKKVNVESEISH
jgi:hypothetical protein